MRPRFASAPPVLLAVLPLIAGLLLLVPAARALAEEPETGTLDALVKEVPPKTQITHTKGNLEWIDLNPQTYEFTPGVGVKSDWTKPADSSYPLEWDRAFQVISDDGLPEYTVRFANVLAWVNPLTGETEDVDFECHYKGVRARPGATHFEVQQMLVNGFNTVNIAESEVTYRIYKHGSDTAIDPGLFVYWCRSLNPGECIGFRKSRNEGIALDSAYVTSTGLYGESFADQGTVDPGHRFGSSVIVSEDEGGDVIKFTGAGWLRCNDAGRSILDVADAPQIFDGTCPSHGFVDGAKETEPTLVVHGESIPYAEHVQYRAVTLDVASGSGSTDGLTLSYFTDTEQFYWEMQFNGIVVTRHLPTKRLLGEAGSQPLAGDEVTFAVNQSMDDIPEGLVSELVFKDVLDDRLAFQSAKLFVDDDEVTNEAGTLSESNGTVTYTFNEAGLATLRYGDEGSECTLQITAKVKASVDPGAVIPNTATVTMNGDDASTPEVTVTVGKPDDPDTDVEEPKGSLLLKKTAHTRSHDGTAKVGERITYWISVLNDSDITMKHVVIQDALPEGLIIRGAPRLLDENLAEIDEGECEHWEGQVDSNGNILQMPDGFAGSPEEAPGYVWAGTVNAEVPQLGPGKYVHVVVEGYVAQSAPALIRNIALAKADDYTQTRAIADVQVLDGDPNPGGNTPGQSGGNTPGGNPGGTTPGGTTPGGDKPGGDNPGGGSSSGGSSDDRDPDGKDPSGGGPSGGSGTEDPGDKDPSGDAPGDGQDGKDPDGDEPGADDPSGKDPNNPSDADDPSTGDPDNSGGSGGPGGSDSPGSSDGTGGDSDGSGTDGDGGTGGTGGSDNTGGTGGTGGGTGPNGSTGGNGGTYGGSTSNGTGTMGGTGTRDNASAARTASAGQRDANDANGSNGTGGKRLLPQTDTPPAIGIATTGGIGMTGALVAHSIWTARNRRR